MIWIQMLERQHFLSISVLQQHLRPWVLASPSILVMGRYSRSASRSASRGRRRDRSRSGGRGGRGGGSGGGSSKFQEMVDERTQCRRNRDFDKADRLRDELKDMGVRIDDTENSWTGPNGESGSTNGNGGGKGGGGGGGYGGGDSYGGGGKGGGERRDGDWDCPKCGKMVFASKDECFSCGEPKPSGGGGRGGDRDRRSSRYDDDDRKSSRYDDDRRGGRDYDDDRRGGGGYGGRDRDDDRRRDRY